MQPPIMLGIGPFAPPQMHPFMLPLGAQTACAAAAAAASAVTVPCPQLIEPRQLLPAPEPKLLPPKAPAQQRRQICEQQPHAGFFGASAPTAQVPVVAPKECQKPAPQPVQQQPQIAMLGACASVLADCPETSPHAACYVNNSLEAIQHFLGDPAALHSLINDLCPKGRLEEEQMVSMAAELGRRINVPPENFGDLRSMFYRFDFHDGDSLRREELERLVLFVLRLQRDNLMNHPGGVRICDLPWKDLNKAFEIQERVGQGGQGTVYLAEDRATGTKRVVKFFAKSHAHAPLDDIKEEFVLLKSLDHPGIARICEVFEDHSNVYLVSEPYFGGDLTKMMCTAREKLGIENVTYRWVGQVLKQVLEAVAFLHSKMVMHCDLKEPNIMMAQESDWRAPDIVIIDFGLAKDFSRKGFGGTPGYMPPEVWQSELWTCKGDMFALAVTFWGLFTGKQGGPFLDPDDEFPYDKIRHNTLTKRMDCGVVMVPTLRELMGRMADKDFKKRPTARQALQSPFFQADSLRKDDRQALNPVAIGVMERNMRWKSNQNMVAMHALEAENLHQLRELQRLFRQLDVNGDGCITQQEARTALERQGIAPDKANGFIDALVGEGGKVQYSEFMARLLVSQKEWTSAQLFSIFSAIDGDKDGFLQAKEISSILADPIVAQLMRDRSAEEVLREMDDNGDGRIDYAEFERAMLRDSRPKLEHGIGDSLQYKSSTLGRWVDCKVTAVDSRHVCLQIDVKPGVWLYPEDIHTTLRRCPQQQSSQGSDEPTPPAPAPAARVAKQGRNVTAPASQDGRRLQARAWHVGDPGEPRTHRHRSGRQVLQPVAPGVGRL